MVLLEMMEYETASASPLLGFAEIWRQGVFFLNGKIYFER